MTRRSQTLYRDTNDRMITGVCSGLGHYFDIDTTLVRIAFVVFTVLGGGGILAYLLLSIILEPKPLGLDTPAAVPPPMPPAQPPPVAATEPIEVDAEPATESVAEPVEPEGAPPEPAGKSPESSGQ